LRGLYRKWVIECKNILAVAEGQSFRLVC